MDLIIKPLDTTNTNFSVLDRDIKTDVFNGTGVVQIPTEIWNGSLEACNAFLQEAQLKVEKFQALSSTISSYMQANPIDKEAEETAGS